MDKTKLEVLAEKKNELKILLEQSQGYSHSLDGDLEILKNKVFELRDAACHAQETKIRVNFALRLLQSERDSTKSQLSNARKDFESKSAHLNTKLLTILGS